MDKIALLRDIFDNKIIDVVRLFLSNPNKQFYLKEISVNVKVPMATTHRILKKLTRFEIILETNISKFKVYQLNNNDSVMFLRSFIKESPKVIEIFLERISSLNGITRIIQHGKESEDKVNMLIMGEGVDSTEVKRIIADIRDEFNYHISYMVLTDEQYSQMSSMGLYSGTKRLLFERE